MLVFVSYARRDLPFARALSRGLADEGIATWLDVAELTPGSDWADAITDALERCGALVLVASATSLSSVHCAHEWQRVLARGRRVVLAVVEPLTPPDELREEPAVDLRESGPLRWDKLAAVIRYGTAPTDRAAPSLSRLRLPTPLRFAAVALALLLVFQLGLFADVLSRALEVAVDARRPAEVAVVTAHVAILVLWIAFTARWSWRFLHRDGTDGALLGMLVVPVLWVMHAIFAGPSAGLSGFFVSLGLLAIAAPAVGRDLQVWTPATRHRPRRRPGTPTADDVLAGAPRSSPRAPAAIRPVVRYAIHYAPQDGHVADEVHRAMSGQGLQAAARNEPTDVHLLVLSNATEAGLAARATVAASGSRTICIVASTVDIPDDLAIFHRHQWLDLRRQDDSKLAGLAAWLRQPSTARRPSVETDPVGFTRLVLPVDVALVVGFLVVMAAVLAFAVLQPALHAAHDPSAQVPAPWELVPALAGAAVAAGTAAAVRARAVTYRWFVVAFLLACALALAWLAAAPGTGVAAPILVAGPAAWVFLINRRGLRRWLPALPVPWRDHPTLAPEPVVRTVVRQFAGTLAATVAASVIVASGEALDR